MIVINRTLLSFVVNMYAEQSHPHSNMFYKARKHQQRSQK